jgi:hypothetical protein
VMKWEHVRKSSPLSAARPRSMQCHIRRREQGRDARASGQSHRADPSNVVRIALRNP